MTAPNYRATLTTYLRPQKGRVALLALALLGSIGLQLVVPLILQRFIDAALGGADTPVLVRAGVIYLIAGVANQFLSAAATYLGALVGWVATNALRLDLTRHLLGLDMSYHAEITPGEMIERIDGDVTALSDFLSRFTVRLLGSALLLVGVMVVCWFKDWRIGLAVTIYSIALVLLLGSMRKLAVDAAEEEREASARQYGFIEERLAGVDDIRANGAGPEAMRRFLGVGRYYYFKVTAAWRKRVRIWVTANTAFWAGDAIALAVGVYLNVQGAITIGTAYLLLQYFQLVRTPIEQVAQQLQELQKAAGGIIRIDQARSLQSKLDETGTATLPDGPLAIDFDNVDFSYEERVTLEDVDFHLAPGTVLGLLGRTGGGKTTITRLIARLYDPDRGSVRIGGLDLRQVSPDSLRGSVGVVTQDVQLFRGTVRDNLTFFDNSRPDADILEVLDRAGLGPWIGGLGLDKQLGSDGEGLSAGEAQLLAFARVFLQDPGVVILDEPSSRLDPATEGLLAAATERLFRGRTVVIVAHRLETVRRADEIMVVEAGHIAEHGARRDLAADPSSRYARLLNVRMATP